MRALEPDDPRLDGWYHTIELAPGVVTKGHYDLRPVLDRYHFPADLGGKRVLDVGCANGFFSFELERRGGQVVALDLRHDVSSDWVPTTRRTTRPPLGQQFALARDALGSRVEYRQQSIYDLSIADTGVFDLVFCGSLLLHLMHPLAALLALRQVTRELLVIETARAQDLEDQHPDDPVLRFGSRAHEEGLPLGAKHTYWWLNSAALKEMLHHAGFRDVTVLEPFELPPDDFPALVAHASP